MLANQNRLSTMQQASKEPYQTASMAVEEEILTDYFIAKYGLTLEQINHDLAICREFEGE